MSEENDSTTTVQTDDPNTSGGEGKNTGSTTTGTDTDTAQNQAQTDITQSPEFKAALTAAVERKVPQLKRALARELTGEKEGGATVEDLQRQLSEAQTQIRSHKSRDVVSEFATNERNKLNIKPENLRGIQELVIPRLEYDEDGNPANVKEAFEFAKAIAPSLFANTPPSINANEGRNGSSITSNDMNAHIRRAAGIG